jgi:hypothetical protein
MPRLVKHLLILLVVLVGAALVGAHWYVSNLATPNYTRPCSPPTRGASTGGILVLGFGSGPLETHACYAGSSLDVHASVDPERQTLTLTSKTSSLQPFDGGSRFVKVHGSRVDHARDDWRYRVLEAVTPFADLDPREPYGQQDDGQSFTAEVGLPRMHRSADGGTELVVNVGSAATDDSLVVTIVRSSTPRAS